MGEKLKSDDDDDFWVCICVQYSTYDEANHTLNTLRESKVKNGMRFVKGFGVEPFDIIQVNANVLELTMALNRFHLDCTDLNMVFTNQLLRGAHEKATSDTVSTNNVKAKFFPVATVLKPFVACTKDDNFDSKSDFNVIFYSDYR